MARRLSRAGDGRASSGPKDSLGVLLDNQTLVAECRMTLRAHPQNSNSIFLRGAVSPAWATNAKIDRRGYELSKSPRVLKYPPATRTWDVASSQE